jgi:hypothetical protein
VVLQGLGRLEVPERDGEVHGAGPPAAVGWNVT